MTRRKPRRFEKVEDTAVLVKLDTVLTMLEGVAADPVRAAAMLPDDLPMAQRPFAINCVMGTVAACVQMIRAEVGQATGMVEQITALLDQVEKPPS